MSLGRVELEGKCSQIAAPTGACCETQVQEVGTVRLHIGFSSKDMWHVFEDNIKQNAVLISK